MFSLNQGPENVPAIEGQTPHDQRFLDAVDAAMTVRLGCGLDRPDRYRLWVPVPNGTAAKKFPVTVRIDSSWTEEAADFCFTLRLLGGECTDPVVDHEELSFMMTIQSSGAKMSPVGDGRAARIRTKCRQIDVQFV